ncbi:TIGR03089 family protein [Friedmanniella luteola]|uniref:TIGR03089 family protein n=1 Tax=Friedmanniella luteola TaxID=546871 RepID=A0A1H1YH11_9ACTN|nr:TIGR03089 family protein [Friedmanniella luteola]SDT20635.1 TIGR03089 family protein [Friedmanniella luteola]
MSETVSGLLRRRARTAGADPLLTWYQPATGARTELSAVTLLNWVDKTSHLLDELGVAAGDVVHLVLAGEAPGHWVTAVWQLACWQVGAEVAAGDADGAALVVTGPAWEEHAGSAVDVVACSLHPLGLPFGAALPAPVLDYALEVRGQSDVYAAVAQPGPSAAWSDPERRLSQAELVAVDAGPAGRRLVRPTAPWPTALAAVLRPLVAGGSSVVVDGPADEAVLARIQADERADA